MYYGYGYINSSYMDAWLGLSMLSAVLRNLKNDNIGQQPYWAYPYGLYSYNPYRDSLFYHAPSRRNNSGNNQTNSPVLNNSSNSNNSSDQRVGNILGGQSSSQQSGVQNPTTAQQNNTSTAQAGIQNLPGNLPASSSNPSQTSNSSNQGQSGNSPQNSGSIGSVGSMLSDIDPSMISSPSVNPTSPYSNSNNIFGQSAALGNGIMPGGGLNPDQIQALLKPSYTIDNAIGPFSLTPQNGVYPWIGSIPPSGGYISGLPAQSTSQQIFGNPANNSVILNPALTTLHTNFQADMLPYSMLAPYVMQTMSQQQQQSQQQRAPQRIQQPQVVGQGARSPQPQQTSQLSQQSFTGRQQAPQRVTSNDTSVTYKKNGHVKLGKAVQQRLQQIAQNVNCDYKDLFGVMYKESGFKTVPDNWNGKSAVGLLQWTDIAIQDLNQRYGLHLTKQGIANMTIMQQLDLAEITLKREKEVAKFAGNQRLTSSQLYAMNYVPRGAKSDIVASRGDGNYEGNEGLDINGDGKISQLELATRVNRGKAFMDLA